MSRTYEKACEGFACTRIASVEGDPGRRFSPQSQAFNEASFRVPDQAGWQPRGQPIDPHHSSSHRLVSDLPLDDVAGAISCCTHTPGPRLLGQQLACCRVSMEHGLEVLAEGYCCG